MSPAKPKNWSGWSKTLGLKNELRIETGLSKANIGSKNTAINIAVFLFVPTLNVCPVGELIHQIQGAGGEDTEEQGDNPSRLHDLV